MSATSWDLVAEGGCHSGGFGCLKPMSWENLKNSKKTALIGDGEAGPVSTAELQWSGCLPSGCSCLQALRVTFMVNKPPKHLEGRHWISTEAGFLQTLTLQLRGVWSVTRSPGGFPRPGRLGMSGKWVHGDTVCSCRNTLRMPGTGLCISGE